MNMLDKQQILEALREQLAAFEDPLPRPPHKGEGEKQGVA
jgi:hypothetical protein